MQTLWLPLAVKRTTSRRTMLCAVLPLLHTKGNLAKVICAVDAVDVF